jgi:hypothetical protein
MSFGTTRRLDTKITSHTLFILISIITNAMHGYEPPAQWTAMTQDWNEFNGRNVAQEVRGSYRV